MNPKNNTSILLVNNDQYQRKDEAALLREMGQEEILLATNGTEGWSMVKNFDVDFIISSWHLAPDMSGLALLRVVRTDPNFTTIPFVLVVEEVTKTHVVEAGQAGVTDIIVRPFTSDVFMKKVEGVMKAEDDPRVAEVNQLINKGQDLVKQGRYDEALTQFKKVLTVQEAAEVYYNMGYIKTAQGKYEEAILAFRRATQINQAYAQAYQKMGEVYARLGRTNEAQQCMEQAASLFMDKQQDQDAEDMFMKALEMNPNTLNVYNSLGILYRRQGKYHESIQMYRRARRVNPNDENIHYNLARAYLSVNNNREAAKILKRALELNPKFKEAKALLAKITKNG